MTTLPPPEAFLSAPKFRHVLEAYAKHFPYEIVDDIEEITGEKRELTAKGWIRFLPSKQNWHIFELLAFDGRDYVEAVTTALQERKPTDAEIHAVTQNDRPWTKLAFALELDHQNRKSGNATRLLGAGFGRRLWRTARFFGRKGMPFMERQVNGLLRKYARRLLAKSLPDISMRQMLYRILERQNAD